MKILDYINNKTDNPYKDFKLVSVIFDRAEKECTFKFLYKETCKEEDREILSKLIKEYIDEEVGIVVKLKKAYVDEGLIKTIFTNYINRHNTSLSDNFSSSDIRVEIDETISVTISCGDFAYNYLSGFDVRADITAYMQGFFFEPIYIDLEKKDMPKQESNVADLIPAETFILEDNEETKKIKYQKLKFPEDTKNNDISDTAITIDSLTTTMESAQIAGEILFLNEKSFESKRKDKDGNSVIKHYFSFTLKDSTGRINCVYFPTKDGFEKTKEFLVEHKTIVASGVAEDFNGRMNFKVKTMEYCEIVPEEAEETLSQVEFKKEPNEAYIFVKPEPYVELMQENLFAIKDEIGQYLMDNDVVVFDIETTGLDALTCEIIEIGAVKIKNGRIAETFETLIKPKSHIPDEIVNLTGITDDMVKESPNIKQVLPDFYKFCYGTTIMAYNIDFDYKFINIAGLKQGYNFDMRQIDAMFLARAFIPGLKNFKLGTVCKKLGVSLENAHRAVHDATATAEVVIKLSPNIT